MHCPVLVRRFFTCSTTIGCTWCWDFGGLLLTAPACMSGRPSETNGGIQSLWIIKWFFFCVVLAVRSMPAAPAPWCWVWKLCHRHLVLELDTTDGKFKSKKWSLVFQSSDLIFGRFAGCVLCISKLCTMHPLTVTGALVSGRRRLHRSAGCRRERSGGERPVGPASADLPRGESSGHVCVREGTDVSKSFTQVRL